MNISLQSIADHSRSILRHTFTCLLAGGFLLAPITSASAQTKEGPVKIEVVIKNESVKKDTAEDRPLIQIALLLDTSNSMDGLINQAKSQLWAIVNDLAETKKDGKLPKIQVALYEYGNSGIPATKKYIRRVVPMTDELDKVSEALFALKTNGGDEYCGAVIEEATKKLDWSPGHDHYKAIFIAGNEPFTQGKVDYTVSCAEARGKGIFVNTIHCGPESTGKSGKWDHGAKVGGGTFLNINSDKKAVIVNCPQDEQLRRLNVKLNATYLYYGNEGKKQSLRQVELDSKQRAVSGIGGLSSRIITKGKANAYDNFSWDLVDAAKRKGFKLEKLDRNTLPEKYKKLSDEELKKTIETLSKSRALIQKEITKLSVERRKFLANHAKKVADNQKGTLGAALKKAAGSQAASKGFKKK